MKPKNTVIKTINIKATTAQVWHTLTSPDLIKVWMSDAEITIISDWTVGSTIVFQSNVNGNHEYKGEILQVESGKVFQYSSWSKILRLADKPENYSLIEFKLTPVENQTMLIITHSNLLAETAVEHANFYWNSTIQVIKNLVE